jgi:transcriptional regulator with XRE-family HTH domain
MIPNFEILAEQVKIHRDHKGYTQLQLEKELEGVTRSNVAHLEQALRLPPREILEKICKHLDMPRAYWEPFMSEEAILRSNFEITLKELVGEPISALNLDPTVIDNVEKEINYLIRELLTSEQTFDKFNSILVFYGIRPVTKEFFERYLGNESLNSIEKFRESINNYLIDAIRLFSAIKEAYIQLNSSNIEELIKPLAKHDTEHFSQRTKWDRIKIIPDNKLANLGYIAAAKVEKEKKERLELIAFIDEVTKKIKQDDFDIKSYTAKKRRKMDSLLRKFESRIEHGFFSPLFQPDVDLLQREAKRLAPKEEGEIEEIKLFQSIAYENLANYLTADFLDVYVATSMRNEADFISINAFVQSLFEQVNVRQYKLRYFNPTQSWIEDRVAKGLVEALMLKRANICIYMAQKEDTFGKDSEASVSLGQGKPVIVYVPRLYHENGQIDTERFGIMLKKDLMDLISKLDKTAYEEVDDEDDHEALHSILLHLLFDKLSNIHFIEIIRNHWADFDLYGEINKRFGNEHEIQKMEIRKWLDTAIKDLKEEIPTDSVREALTQTLIADALKYERRAKIFREIHPLALQVILSTGVLNGILVVRSVSSCANLLQDLVENKLDLELKIDENNYRLIERKTKSTIRVISRHKLISNAFLTFYQY